MIKNRILIIALVVGVVMIGIGTVTIPNSSTSFALTQQNHINIKRSNGTNYTNLTGSMMCTPHNPCWKAPRYNYQQSGDGLISISYSLADNATRWSDSCELAPYFSLSRLLNDWFNTFTYIRLRSLMYVLVLVYIYEHIL